MQADQSSRPLVSVIIPTKNRPEMLIRAITSVAKQTYPNIEILVVNDGFNNIDQTYVKKNLRLNSFRVLKNNRTPGASGARNTGFFASKGKLVSFLDDDDEWMPEKIEKQVKTFENSSERVGIVFTEHFIVENNKKTRIVWSVQGDVYKELCTEHIPGNTSNPLIKRVVLDEVGLWDEKFPSFQDVDLWLRIAAKYEFAIVPEPLVLFHCHNSNRITLNVLNRIVGRFMMLSKHWSKLPIARKYRFIKRTIILDRAIRRHFRT